MIRVDDLNLSFVRNVRLYIYFSGKEFFEVNFLQGYIQGLVILFFQNLKLCKITFELLYKPALLWFQETQSEVNFGKLI